MTLTAAAAGLRIFCATLPKAHSSFFSLCQCVFVVSPGPSFGFFATSMSAPIVLPTAAASSPSSVAFPRARSLLDRDALGSVLSFLSLHELAIVLSVSKEWISAVQSMRPAMLTVLLSTCQLDDLLVSSLRRHVGQLSQWDGRGLPLLTSHLSELARQLPQLRSLKASFGSVSGAAKPHFPSQLQCLHVLCYPSEDAQQRAATMLAAIGQLQQLHTLRLCLQFDIVSLAPLQRLRTLRDLDVIASFPNATLTESVAELRALYWLGRMRIEAVHDLYTQTHATQAVLYNALLRDVPEHQLRPLQWREFPLVGDVTDELTPLLCRLPLLERVEGNLWRCTRFDFLPALLQLTQLDLSLAGKQPQQHAAWANLLAVFTSDGLTRLRSLALRDGLISSDDLMCLLSHIPALTNLVLFHLQGLSSLAFFQELPKLSETLTHLTVECREWPPLSAADFPPLLSLQQLRELRLLKWPNRHARLTDRVTAAHRAPFQRRPCAVLPHLEVFQWTAWKKG
jgi:hypothetical protein